MTYFRGMYRPKINKGALNLKWSHEIWKPENA